MDFKMKSLSYLRLAAVLVFAIPVSAAAQGPQPAYDPMYQQRFETMDKMIDDAQNRTGKDRRVIILEHLQLMHDQLQSMHGMMDGSVEYGPGKPMTDQNQMTPGGMFSDHMDLTDNDNAQMLKNIQVRIDIIQKTIEQMLKQHELMLKDDS